MTHHKNHCEYGYLHGQCRCPSRDKEIRIITCPTPNMHRPTVDEDEGGVVEFLAEVKKGQDLSETLYNRLEKVVEERFWYLLPSIKKEIVTQLEGEVTNWLIEATNQLRSEDATVHNPRTRRSRSVG